jgi:hypothetical protein
MPSLLFVRAKQKRKSKGKMGVNGSNKHMHSAYQNGRLLTVDLGNMGKYGEDRGDAG